MRIGGTALQLAPRISTIVKDADLDLGSYKLVAPEVDTDTIDEKTGSAGITLLKTAKVDAIQERTTSAGVTVSSVLKAETAKIDHVGEKTGSHGVVIDQDLKPAAAVVLTGTPAAGTSHNTLVTKAAQTTNNAAYQTVTTLQIACGESGTYRFDALVNAVTGGDIDINFLVDGAGTNEIVGIDAHWTWSGNLATPMYVDIGLTQGQVVTAQFKSTSGQVVGIKGIRARSTKLIASMGGGTA